jgi:hypothetical protein
VSRTLFAIVGLPALLRAVLRARASARLPIDERVARLRAAAPFRRAALRDAERWSGYVARVSRWLPVDGGPCLRRSLVLLDLHARCGLEPRLALAFRPDGAGAGDGHAWLTTDDGPRRAAEGVWEPITIL